VTLKNTGKPIWLSLKQNQQRLHQSWQRQTPTWKLLPWKCTYN